MHFSVSWMTPVDDAILRLLASPKSLELRSGDIARNTGVSRRQVTKRVAVLIENGLLYKDENGHPYYGVTDLGQQYTEGALSVDELEQLAADDNDE